MITPENVLKARLPNCSQAGADDRIILEWTGGTNNAGWVSMGVNRLSRSTLDNGPDEKGCP